MRCALCSVAILTGVFVTGRFASADEPVPCSSVTQCASGLYCKYPEGTCGEHKAEGVCVKKPDMCTMIFAPVCGCDGRTYSSECEAGSKGQSVKHKDECTG